MIRRSSAILVLLAFLLTAGACGRKSGDSARQQSLLDVPFGSDLQAALDRALHDGQGEHTLGISAAVIVPRFKAWAGVYLLLTAILERVAGASVPHEVERFFIAPLGLDHAFMSMGELPPSRVTVAHPWVDVDGDGELDDLSGKPQTWIATMTHPVLYSTPEDLARWMQALYRDQRVLSAHSVREMLTVPETKSGDPEGGRYGALECPALGLVACDGVEPPARGFSGRVMPPDQGSPTAASAITPASTGSSRETFPRLSGSPPMVRDKSETSQ